MAYRSSSSSSMTLPTTLLLFALLLPGWVQSQSSSSCGDSQLQAYQQCVQDNACLCANCDLDPLDDYPTIHLDQPPDSCQDINRIFCPLMRCCSVCEDVAQEWYSCAFDDFSKSQLGSTCPQVCSAFDLGDVEGDCQPTAATAAPTSRPTSTVNVSPPPSVAPRTTKSPTTTAAPSTKSPTTAAPTTAAPSRAAFVNDDEVQTTSSLQAGVSAATVGYSLVTGGLLLVIACLI